MVGADNVIEKIIGVIIIASVIGATAGLVLDAFTNLSGLGLALGILFVTVLPLLFAVWVYKLFAKSFK